MKLLDDLYFYLWDKFLRFSLWICDKIDGLTGLDKRPSEEEENDEY